MEDDDYKFLEIKNAIASLNQKVNLIGVVVEFGIPKTTRGTDYFCTLKVIDESYQGTGISVNLFAESMEMLPHVQSVGDIIQLSRVVMKTHNNDVYALFNKRFSSFALYQGKYGKDFIPYQVFPKFRPRDWDKKFIACLRKWLADFQLDAGTKEPFSLRRIRQGECIDLVCKIVHICEVIKDEWMAFVWDGTDAPPVKIETKLGDEMEKPLPLQVEPLPLARDILCTFPTVGTILRVIVDKGNNDKLGLKFLRTGKWVKFRDIICQVNAGLWHGVLKTFTRLQYMSNEDHFVSNLQRFYDERVSSKWERMPYWSFPSTPRVTETDHEDVPFVTLMDIVSFSEVTAKFRCVVRIVAAFPWLAKDFRSPSGIYRIRLTLEDPTARIHAFVYAEDGEKFFGAYPSVDELTKKRNKLLGVTASDDGQETDDAPRNPPWVQCCLKSYYLDKSDVWGTRHYRIFATRLVE